LLELGIHPIVVPRRKSRGEHVDDHQLQICRLVASLGIATVCEPEELTDATLRAAARVETVPSGRRQS
jgi:UDP-N-acetylglucosamine transferase subunit ALG13